MAGSRSSLPDLRAAVAAALAGALATILPGRPKAGGDHRPDTLPLPRLCVGYSGGADSTALLMICRELAGSLGFSLSAIHVHHGLHADADLWADHCRARCQAWDVPFSVEKVRVDHGSNEGPEASARRARYQVFSALEVDAVLLAHHRDDQAETLLLNLLRGSGVHGLAGMPACRLIDRPGRSPLPLIRPMLTVERALIEATLAENGLSWINDSSNADEHLSRNLLRHRALPMLQARFPAKQALAGAAARFAEAAALLDERADEDLASCSVDGVIAINCLVKLSPARQRNLLHRALSVCGGRVASAARLEDLRRQIGHASADTRAVVEFGQLEVHLWRGGLWRVPVTEHAPRLPLSWEGEPELDWASGKLVFQPMMGEGIAAAGPLGESWSIRRRQGGERLKLAWDRPRQQVKHLLQHAAVPPWERDRLPMLWCGERLVWVPGFPIDPGYRVAPGEVGWVPRWLG